MENLDNLKKNLSERNEEIKMWLEYPYWKNVHGFEKSQYRDRLYRVELFDKFKENIINKRLFFRHPREWLKDDRLDSILLRIPVVLPDGTEVRQGYYDETFCQCWSMKDSKEMWEEYGKEKNKAYIKMVTNLDCLMRAFDDTTVFKGYSISFWAGAVNYPDFPETIFSIQLKSEEKVRAFCGLELISQLYLEKRGSFNFENEVRFINFNRKDRKGHKCAFVNLKKPLNQMLEGIIIDSRLSDEAVREEIMSFAKKQGINIIKNTILWD